MGQNPDCATDTMLDFAEFPGPQTREYWRGFGARHFEPIVERPNDGEAFVCKLKDICLTGKVDA